MALPADFWRDAQSLNIFRTKPCQRLLKFPQGCEWRSQCQYSHNLEWPRRPPQKHSYRPEVCTHLRRTQAANGEVQIENLCSLDKSCRNAHSKEEVLWHPDIFKTVLCEEYQVSSRSGHKNAQKKKCQRYYCPFAHGAQELRPSRFSKQEREHLIEQAELFFPIERCQPCSPQVSGTQNNAKGSGMVFLTSNGHSTQQEVSSPPHSTPAYYMSMALPDGQSDGKNHYPPSPYQQQQQFSPNGHWIQVRQPLVSPDHSQFAMAQGGLGNEGCGVPSQQMQQEVVQTTNGVPQGSGGVQQPQMMIMQPPMGCMGTPVPHSPAAFPVQQWTPPMGQTGGIGLMPVQVAAINNNAGHDNGVCNSSEVVANLLRSAGLAHHTESFEHNGFLDIEPEALVGMSASRLGISEVEHESLKNVFVEMQKGSGGRNNMAMMPSSAPRTPSVPQHCIALVDQYGNWIPANSPGPLNSESYAYGSPGPFSAPWVNSNGTPHQQQTAMMSNCFIQSVHGDQRQQAVPQQDGIMIFGQIPPFPQFDSNPQQQHQAMAHLQQSGGQNGVHCAPMPQQRNNQPSSHVQQPFYPQLGQQPQALQQNQPQPHMQPPPQIAQQGALCNGTQGSMQSLPTSDDSPASQQIAETESNGHASAKLKKRNLKIGNRPMRDVNEDRGMSFRESRSAPALQDRAEKEVPDRWHQLR